MNLRYTPIELESKLRRVRPVLYLGHAKLYAGVAGVDPSILPRDARFVVDDAGETGARPWTALHGNPASARFAGGADLHAPALLLATSGTTGQPKFAARSLSTLTHIAARHEHLGLMSG